MTFDAKLLDRPYTGRVWVLTGRGGRREPRFGPDWFDPSPFFARDVKEWKPGEPLIFDDDALSFPRPMRELNLDGMQVQAVMAINPDARQHGAGVGNGYSDMVTADAEKAGDAPVKLRIHKRVKPRKPPRSDRIRPFEVESRLLSRFHGRRIEISGAVILPEEYAGDENRRFPALYIFPGFGQTRDSATWYVRPTGESETPLVRVLLECDCGLGLHEFADSANNGPCGQALVEEVIPWLEQHYRLIPEADARFTTGHSSGGWASLWAQVAYPDYFGGCWSTSPDPVDFRDFTNVNIYEKDGNAFRDAQGNLLPLARHGASVLLTFKQFSDMDHVVGRGEQLGSFEAVFSPRGPDGNPAPLWDRRTGKLDPDVARHWEKYDIRLVLERNWATLGPKLAGKLHIYVGDEDTFYLDGAVRLLKKSLKKLGSDAEVKILKGYDHGSIMLAEDLRRIPEKVSRQFKARNAGAMRQR